LDKESLIIAPQSCLSKISGNVKKIEEGEKIEVKGVIIEAFPAYNLNKQFHPKGKGVGYIITLNNKRIYHAGDTDFIPEMKNLKNIDIALIPVGGTYTMDAEEAAEAVNSFKPKVAIPMHYGSIVGSRQDALNFKKLVKESEVKILE
jgi:L-ascorbate metabolism protein UlaG (beta-lactamase superfamily)